ncbi:MAG: hypothetical protein M1840_004274 [Geoglossum simile]|nr:MAG: hypothetical protein M1840_004274 [Geoglossum simile]
MPETSKYNANDRTHPDWESLALRMENLKEKFAAAKGLVTLCKDEDELFDSHKKGFGPSYLAAIEPADPSDISAAQTLIDISHHVSSNALFFSGDGNYSAGNLENTVPFCRNYSPEDSSGNAHYAAREVIAKRRGATGWADPAYPMSIECPSYYHTGDTTDDDSELYDNAISENEAHTGGTSDEDGVVGNPVVLAMRPSIKLVLPARPSPSPKSKAPKKTPKSPPKARERKATPKKSNKKKPTTAPQQPMRRSARMQKRRVPFAGTS